MICRMPTGVENSASGVSKAVSHGSTVHTFLGLRTTKVSTNSYLKKLSLAFYAF